MKTPDPTKAESNAPNSVNFTGTAKFLGAFPTGHNTVTAEVLSRLLNGQNLTGMDAVFATIRRAFDAGALEFCRSVQEARAKTRKHASKAKAEAAKRNAARAAAKFDPNQGSLFSGGAP